MSTEKTKLWITFTVMPEEIAHALNEIERIGGTIFSVLPLFDAKLLVLAHGDADDDVWVGHQAPPAPESTPNES